MTRPEIKPFRRMDGDPVFDEPWQAQVLAIVDTLIINGTIGATAWSDCLGSELKKTQLSGANDNITTYYKAVLKALEQLLDRYTDISETEVSNKRDAWEQAYRATPHGQPVNLK